MRFKPKDRVFVTGMQNSKNEGISKGIILGKSKKNKGWFNVRLIENRGVFEVSEKILRHDIKA